MRSATGRPRTVIVSSSPRSTRASTSPGLLRSSRWGTCVAIVYECSEMLRLGRAALLRPQLPPLADLHPRERADEQHADRDRRADADLLDDVDRRVAGEVGDEPDPARPRDAAERV